MWEAERKLHLLYRASLPPDVMKLINKKVSIRHTFKFIVDADESNRYMQLQPTVITGIAPKIQIKSDAFKAQIPKSPDGNSPTQSQWRESIHECMKRVEESTPHKFTNIQINHGSLGFNVTVDIVNQNSINAMWTGTREVNEGSGVDVVGGGLPRSETTLGKNTFEFIVDADESNRYMLLRPTVITDIAPPIQIKRGAFKAQVHGHPPQWKESVHECMKKVEESTTHSFTNIQIQQVSQGFNVHFDIVENNKKQ